MDQKPKQQKRRLDRRNAIRNIEFDASTSPSCPFDGRSHHGAGSLDISTISDDRTSFRLRGNDGEFDRICRSLGLSGPEDFAIPAEDWEARKSRSTLDHLTSPRFRIYQNSDIYGTGISEPAEDGLSDAFEAKARVSDDLKKGNDFSQLKNGLKLAQIEVRIRKNDKDPNGQVHSVRHASSVRTYRNSGSGIKGARPPVLAPPPLAMSPPCVENGLFSFDPQDDEYLNSPVNLGSVCSVKQGEKVEEGDRRIVAKQDIDRALVRDDSESCSDTSNDDKVEDSSKMRPKSLYAISPNGTFKCSIKSWQKGECLGSGSFGTVYEGFTDDGFFFAVKEVSLLDQGTQGKQSLKQLEQEILLLSQFEHENIVQYLGTDKDDSKLYIFLELVTKGSLASLYRKYHLWDPQVSAYTRQILNGLNYLHSRKVVHRDIKCANILVHASGSVKLADFGLAKATTFNDVKSCKGTPFWMAPEVVNQKHGYGLAADIWSLGCTVLEMLTRQVPYSHLEGMAALFRIGRGKPPPIPDSLSADARDFILKCLQVNPEDRPPAAQLLEHPFVKRPLSTFPGPPSPYHNSTRAQKVL